jgi:hypothetical protein
VHAKNRKQGQRQMKVKLEIWKRQKKRILEKNIEGFFQMVKAPNPLGTDLAVGFVV